MQNVRFRSLTERDTPICPPHYGVPGAMGEASNFISPSSISPYVPGQVATRPVARTRPHRRPQVTWLAVADAIKIDIR